MKILIVAATQIEIDQFQNSYKENIDFLVTGIGVPLSILRLYKVLNAQQYDFIVNIGIAGSFTKKLNIGDVVQVESDLFADIGFEDDQIFIPISQSKFSATEYETISNKNSDISICKLKKVKSITVNTVSGKQSTIDSRKQLFSADIETMEGAAIATVANDFNIPHIQIRSISNYVKVRDKASWDIPLAIKNLTHQVEKLMEQILSR